MDVEPVEMNNRRLRSFGLGAALFVFGVCLSCRTVVAETRCLERSRSDTTSHARWKEDQSGFRGMRQAWSGFWENRKKDCRKHRRKLYEKYHSHHHHMLYPRYPVEWSATYGYYETQWQRFPALPNWCPPAAAYVPQTYALPLTPPSAPPATSEPSSPGGQPPVPAREPDDYFPPAIPQETPPEPAPAESPSKLDPSAPGRIQLEPPTIELQTFEQAASRRYGARRSGQIDEPEPLPFAPTSELFDLKPFREPPGVVPLPATQVSGRPLRSQSADRWGPARRTLEDQ